MGSGVTRVCGANVAAASPALVGGTRMTSTTHSAGWGQLRRPLASPLRPKVPAAVPCTETQCQWNQGHTDPVTQYKRAGSTARTVLLVPLSPWARRWGQGHSEKWPLELGPLPLPTRVREHRAGRLVELRGVYSKLISYHVDSRALVIWGSLERLSPS